MHLATPGNMPLMGGTLRAPSLHLIIPSLRFSYALSTKHFSSLPSAPLNPTPKPLSSFFSAASSQRQSIEHSPSNPTKPRLNQTKPPNKRPERPKPSPDAGSKREAVVTMNNKQKENRVSPAGLLEKKLHHCLKRGQIVKALRLYDTAVACGIPLSVCHYNYLLQLCSLPSSSSSIADVTSEAADVSNGEGDGGSDIRFNDAEAEFSDPEIRKMAVERGFEIYTRMREDPGVEPNEATFTFLDRLKTQRHSIKQLASNPTKPRTNQAMPPNKTPKNPKPSTDATAKRELVVSVKKKRQEYRDSPTGLLQRDLDQCSKRGHTVRALELYDSAVAAGTPLSIRHYNCLLYLCSLPSSSSSIADSTNEAPGVSNGEGDGSSDGTSNDAEAKFNDPEISKMAVERGFEIYRRMCEDPSLEPNEATFTSMARLAAMKGDPHMAFDLVKQTLKRGMPIRLRSYGPALHGFCDVLDVEMAHEVETHMDAHGVVPEEPELAALLCANATKGRADHVYRLLHRIRTLVRQVSEPTAEMIQSWFRSDAAATVGASEWDIDKIKQGVVQGGGGWHGQGWLGTGHWRVERSVMSKDGVCEGCGEKLVCIDIDPSETEGFARSLMEMPYFKKNKNQFLQFKEWLQKNGPFDAVIDAANIGLCNQREFSFYQVNSVIKQMREVSPSKKMPLIILHARRVHDRTAYDPRNRKLIEDWKSAGCLYCTPPGANDDWYWLYAAVSFKCLLVTNDEMRDHLFQLLGTSFFPRWKEKHQVRLTFSGRGLTLHMPPPYSIVVQESENGSWHVPTTTGDDLEMPRQWICVTRDSDNAVTGATTSLK